MNIGDRVVWHGGSYSGEAGTVTGVLKGGYIQVVFDRWPHLPMLVAASEIRRAA
jgi:hypothetical protein